MRCRPAIPFKALEAQLTHEDMRLLEREPLCSEPVIPVRPALSRINTIWFCRNVGRALARRAVCLPFLSVLEAEAVCEDERLLERKRLSQRNGLPCARFDALGEFFERDVEPNRQTPADFDDSLASLTTLDGWSIEFRLKLLNDALVLG
jgi:hypothetical protein